MSVTIADKTVAVRLNEVEAYRGRDDPASHAFGSRTARNEPMYGPAGTIYVYRSYGIHWCMNLVTGAEEDPQGVLLRGGSVTEGLKAATERRGRTEHLADGPGKLAQALGVSGDLSGTHLTHGVVSVSDLGTVHHYETTPRIGISTAKTRPWRFLTLDSDAVPLRSQRNEDTS